jgi:Tectonin domain
MKRVPFWSTLVLLCSVMPICASAQSFSLVPGQLTSISVGGTQTGAAAVWGINSAQNIFEFDGMAFQNIPGNLTQIAVDGDTVWGINANGNVFKLDPDQGMFVQILGNLSQIAAHGGATWGIDANQNVYQYDGTGFVQVPGKLTQIAVDGPAVWGINASQNVFVFNEIAISGNTLERGFRQIPGSLTAIAVGVLGTEVWGINANQNVFRFDATSQTFVNVPGKLESIAVGGPLIGPIGVWGINANQNIFFFDFTSGKLRAGSWAADSDLCIWTKCVGNQRQPEYFSISVLKKRSEPTFVRPRSFWGQDRLQPNGRGRSRPNCGRRVDRQRLRQIALTQQLPEIEEKVSTAVIAPAASGAGRLVH